MFTTEVSTMHTATTSTECECP